MVEAAMRYLSTFLIVLSMILPAMSVELFRYRGAAKDGGTLEYIFEAEDQNSPNAVTKEKAAEIAADCMTTDDLLPRIGRRVGDSGISHIAGPVLARLLFGHSERTTAPNVLCRLAA